MVQMLKMPGFDEKISALLASIGMPYESFVTVTSPIEYKASRAVSTSLADAVTDSCVVFSPLKPSVNEPETGAIPEIAPSAVFVDTTIVPVPETVATTSAGTLPTALSNCTRTNDPVHKAVVDNNDVDTNGNETVPKPRVICRAVCNASSLELLLIDTAFPPYAIEYELTGDEEVHFNACTVFL